MAKINLLPWRQELREERKKEFFIMAGLSAVAAVVVMGLLWAVLDSRLSRQVQANQMVKDATEALSKDLSGLDGLDEKRTAIVDRIKLIQDLQGKRPIVVHIFDEIVRNVPPNMYLTRIKRAGDTLEISGKAESPNVVSDFMRRLDDSPWFQNSFMSSYTTPANGGAPVTPAPPAPPAPAGAPLVADAAAAAASVAASPAGLPPVSGGHPEDAYGTFTITVKLQQQNNWVDEGADQLKETAKTALGALQKAAQSVIPGSGGEAPK